jgi:hypothetical protein
VITRLMFSDQIISCMSTFTDASALAASALCYCGPVLTCLSAQQAAKLLGRTPKVAARRAKGRLARGFRGLAG